MGDCGSPRELPWEPAGTSRGAPASVCGSPWEPVGFHGFSREIPREPAKTNPLEPMGYRGPHGNPWVPTGAGTNPLEPMGIHGFPQEVRQNTQCFENCVITRVWRESIDWRISEQSKRGSNNHFPLICFFIFFVCVCIAAAVMCAWCVCLFV